MQLLGAPPGALVFHLVGETNPDAELTATEKAGLTLHVCGQAFTFASAKRVGDVTTVPAGPGRDRHYIWETAGLTWSDGLVRTLTLSMPTSMQVSVDPPEVDGTPQVSGEGEDGSWSAGESVEVTLSFSEAVAVNTSGGTPSLEIRLGGTAAHSAEYLSGSGTSTLVFSYTLGNSESSYTSVSVTPNSLALNGGTIRSAETQAAALLAHNGTVVQGSSTRNTRNEVPVSPTVLKATFSNPPKHHDGSSKFVVDLTFSKEPVGLSYQTVGGSLLDVTGGSVVEARRLTEGSNTDWRVTIRPSVQGDVTITLPVRACTETNAVCVDGEALASSASITVPGPETYTEEPVPETLEPITASWVLPPGEHDGSTAFDLHLKFSHEPVDFSYRSIAGGVVNVQGGTITRVWRRVEGRNRQWVVQVTPSGNGDVTASVNGTGQCREDHAVCDAAGRKLATGAEVRVKGPAMLSVADAEAEEADGATLDFVVTMSRGRTVETTVNYATSNGTGTAGEDYTATSGTLSFGISETSQTVSVPVLNNEHDDGGETVTFTLSSPTGARLGDAVATGTIENSDAQQDRGNGGAKALADLAGPTELAIVSAPNPFNPTTTLYFQLPEAARVFLAIYNLKGQQVATVINGEPMDRGFHNYLWTGQDDNGQSLAAGIYLYRLVAGDKQRHGKVALIR